jgi:DNA-binding MarR family transcriptional regulator
MAIKAIDTLLAIKVMNVIDGLTPTDRQVGVALLEHYNRRTGQCDPSNSRIAELLRVSSRTVIRATKRLEDAALFIKVRHGGYGNRNSYTPNWQRFADSHSAWVRKLSRLSESRLTGVSPASGQSCHTGSDSSGIQTCNQNLQNQPQLFDPTKIERSTIVAAIGKEQFRKGISSSVAAQTAAERRWSDALLRQFRTTPLAYASVVDAITPEIQVAATNAELHRPGSGIGFILNALSIGADQ